MGAKAGLALLAIVATLGAMMLFAPSANAAPALPRLSISDNSTLEGNAGTRSITFDVTLSAPSSQTVSVQYSTVDDFGILPGLAFGAKKITTANTDYGAKYNKTLSFKPGQVDKPVSINIVGDTTDEGNEQFSVSLSSPEGATISDGTGTGTIIDDDPGSGFRLGIGDASIRVPSSGIATVHLAVSFSDAAPSTFPSPRQPTTDRRSARRRHRNRAAPTTCSPRRLSS